MPGGVTCRVVRHGASLPVRLDAGDALHRTIATACTRVWGRAPAVLRSGGSIRAGELFSRAGLPTALLGFAPADDNAHGPNEWLPLENLGLGARAPSPPRCCTLRFRAVAPGQGTMTAAPVKRPARRSSNACPPASSGYGWTSVRTGTRGASARNSSPSRRVRLATERIDRSCQSSS